MNLRNTALAVPVFLGVAVLSGFLARGGSKDKKGQIQVDGRERSYLLHVPAGLDEAKGMPLLLALHGRLGTGPGEEKLGHLDSLSDEHRFLAVYPDGLDRSWADGRGGTPSDHNGVDDVKFLSALIDKIESEHNVDPARIYATGMSNGGFMSGRLACDMADRIAAVAIVGASLAESLATCHPAKPVSVLIMQGTEDPLVPFKGGELRRAAAGTVLSHDAAIQKFVQANHCTGHPATKHIPDSAGDGTSIDVVTYTACAGNSEVQGYTVNGGGHTWPGGTQYLPAMLIGKTSQNLDASEVIWEFLSRHARYASAGPAQERQGFSSDSGGNEDR